MDPSVSKIIQMMQVWQSQQQYQIPRVLICLCGETYYVTSVDNESDTIVRFVNQYAETFVAVRHKCLINQDQKTGIIFYTIPRENLHVTSCTNPESKIEGVDKFVHENIGPIWFKS
jgi:hypothetical protein